MCWHRFVPPIPSLPQASESAQFLCQVQGLDSLTELYRQHMGQLLDWLSASVNTWCSYSPQRLQLHVIVMQSGEKWSLNVHKKLPNYMGPTCMVFLGAMLILGSKYSDICLCALILYIQYQLEVVIKYLWQRYIMETGYFSNLYSKHQCNEQ